LYVFYDERMTMHPYIWYYNSRWSSRVLPDLFGTGQAILLGFARSSAILTLHSIAVSIIHDAWVRANSNALYFLLLTEMGRTAMRPYILHYNSRWSSGFSWSGTEWKSVSRAPGFVLCCFPLLHYMASPWSVTWC